MNKIIFLLFSLFIAISCSSSKTKNKEDNNIVSDNTKTTNKDITIYPEEKDVVIVPIENQRGSVSLYKKERQQVSLKFNSQGYKKITATIRPKQENANIRFNQIILPDDSMDGPFGRELQYDLPLNGNYTLIVGESLMAGDPWSGYFDIDIHLNN